ncbi:MAG: hypothetical protein IKZ59_05960 [Clostridia bacterium]|nr:hypothetical protein [Clostridia bacterium]
MDFDKRRDYLKRYRILISKIARLRRMAKICPENRKKYEAEIGVCIAERDGIEKAICNVDGGLLTEILALKYMCGKTLEEIALDICYSKRQTERLHLKALKLLEI